MASRDPLHCRDQLAILMAEQNAQLAALEGLLTHEHALLQTRDADGLENSGAARQQCIGHILRLEDERRALCRATGRSEKIAKRVTARAIALAATSFASSMCASR